MNVMGLMRKELMRRDICHLLIISNILIYVSIFVLEGGDIVAGNWKLGSLHNVFITLEGEYYRFITALFLHGSWSHLLMNMLSLWIVGRLIEKVLGSIHFLILYMVGGLASTLSSYFLTLWEIDYPNYVMESVGASGAIFGIVGGFWIYLLRNRRKVFEEVVRRRMLLELGIIVVLNIGFGYFLGGALGLNIDNAGHIGGLLGGVLYGIFINVNIGKEGKWIKYIWVSMVGLIFGSFVNGIYLYIMEKRILDNWVSNY